PPSAPATASAPCAGMKCWARPPNGTLPRTRRSNCKCAGSLFVRKGPKNFFPKPRRSAVAIEYFEGKAGNLAYVATNDLRRDRHAGGIWPAAAGDPQAGGRRWTAPAAGRDRRAPLRAAGFDGP